MELMPRFAEKIRDKAREEGLSHGHQQGLANGRAEGLEQGLAQGVLDGQRQIVERLLTVRFGQLPDGAIKRIRSSSLGDLEQWTRNLCDAPSLSEVFCA
ncbi:MULTISPECIES: DUF4351 domain-containing protein [unclassified Duganella]|uniref:DUF4351 domain-containing protein n=1 Tax=unclassified Duganella TaxID=2636909 RepID=UPI000A4F24F1|nr:MULTISPECIES: DUF4351 domain-containing protein [unclassified Duganella]